MICVSLFPGSAQTVGREEGGKMDHAARAPLSPSEEADGAHDDQGDPCDQHDAPVKSLDEPLVAS